MCRFYFDSRYGDDKPVSMGPHGVTNTSVWATTSDLARFEVYENTTVKDFNLAIRTGATCTGGINYTFLLGKSLAGTGAVTAIGTASLATAADFSVVDGAVTATNLVVGDQLVIQRAAGTALPASSVVIENATVSVVEHFVADQVV